MSHVGINNYLAEFAVWRIETMEDFPFHSAASPHEHDRRSSITDDEHFALLSVELQQIIEEQGYTSHAKRMSLFDLEPEDAADMGLTVCLRKEMEAFLRMPNGALRVAMRSVSRGSSTLTEDAAPTRVASRSTYATPCGGRGGQTIADFPLASSRVMGWTRRAKTMNGFITLHMLATAEMVEPRMRECLDDFNHLESLPGGKSLAVLLVELVVFYNISQPGACWSLDTRDIDGIISVTFEKLFARQLGIEWRRKFQNRIKAITRRKPYPGIVPTAEDIPG